MDTIRLFLEHADKGKTFLETCRHFQSIIKDCPLTIPQHIVSIF